MKHKLRFTLLLLLSLNIHSQQWVLKGNPIIHENDNDVETISLSADGLTIAIGDDKFNNEKVYVYTWNGNSWAQKGNDITFQETENDDFGDAIALSDDASIVAVGLPRCDLNGNNSGSVVVYQWDGTTWNTMGNRIDGINSNDNFGQRTIGMSADGLTMIIGARLYDGSRTNSGHVRTFQWDVSSSTWNLKGSSISGKYRDGAAGEHVSMSADGNTMAFSDPTNDGGEIYIYTWNNTTETWEQKGNTIFGDNGDGWAGTSVSLSDNGNTIAFGAPRYENFTGIAKVYSWNSTIEDWEQKGSTLALETEETFDDSWFGREIDLNASGNILVLSAYSYDYDQDENNISNSGIVKAFKWNGTDWEQLGNTIYGTSANCRLGEHAVRINHDGNIISFAGNDNGTTTTYVYELDENLSTKSNDKHSIKLHPNPIKDVLYIDKKLSNCTLQIFSLDGKLVYDKFLKNTSIPIQLEYLQPGIYIAKLKTNEQTFSQKLIKE